MNTFTLNEYLSSLFRENKHFKITINSNIKGLISNYEKNTAGIYLIYNELELFYIGRSGELVGVDIQYRGNGLIGRFMTGKQAPLGEKKRISKRDWIIRNMQKSDADSVFISFYVTFSESKLSPKLCPVKIESELLNKYRDSYNKLPKWNRQCPKKKFSNYIPQDFFQSVI